MKRFNTHIDLLSTFPLRKQKISEYLVMSCQHLFFFGNRCLNYLLFFTSISIFVLFWHLGHFRWVQPPPFLVTPWGLKKSVKKDISNSFPHFGQRCAVDLLCHKIRSNIPPATNASQTYQNVTSRIKAVIEMTATQMPMIRSDFIQSLRLSLR